MMFELYLEKIVVNCFVMYFKGCLDVMIYFDFDQVV